MGFTAKRRFKSVVRDNTMHSAASRRINQGLLVVFMLLVWLGGCDSKWGSPSLTLSPSKEREKLGLRWAKVDYFGGAAPLDRGGIGEMMGA